MRVALSLVVALLLTGCEADLGTCDMTAATQLVYSSDGTPYYEGQALVQQSCAGSFCHVSTATGMNRFGAPHGLDFDVNVLVPQSQSTSVSALQAGVAKIRDEANDMYGEIDDGAMPPGAKGDRPLQSWTHADKSAAALDIRTDQGKTIVRNWLACQAPVVAGVTGAPQTGITHSVILDPMTVTSSATFSSFYNSVLTPKCLSCHTAGGPFSAMTPLDFTTPATAYASLFNKDSSTTGMCGGRKLITPGNCDTSLLYEKLLQPPAAIVCGARMPLTGDPVPAAMLTPLCDWIKAGALQN